MDRQRGAACVKSANGEHSQGGLVKKEKAEERKKKAQRGKASEHAHLTWPVCEGDSCREKSRLASHSEALQKERNSMTSAKSQETLQGRRRWGSSDRRKKRQMARRVKASEFEQVNEANSAGAFRPLQYSRGKDESLSEKRSSFRRFGRLK